MLKPQRTLSHEPARFFSIERNLSNLAPEEAGQEVGLIAFGFDAGARSAAFIALIIDVSTFSIAAWCWFGINEYNGAKTASTCHSTSNAGSISNVGSSGFLIPWECFCALKPYPSDWGAPKGLQR
jgi:hypothetical protein